ncbi:MAG TPA: RNA polymerase sporulation sigma factor SigH [Armatimonadota bacterium]|nr:RNA polymerase sporulation sigma factor SigH [Armatimonadota bacterium]
MAMIDTLRPATPKKRLKYLDMDDAEIVRDAQAGECDATEYLLHKYQGLVRAKLKSYFLLGAEKEDLVQVGMLGLWEAIMDFREDKEVSFRCFAQMCVQRELITAIKAATRQRQTPLNSSLSLDAHVYPDSPEKSLCDFLPCLKNKDPQEVWTDAESATHLKRSIRQRLSGFEWKVFKAYLEGMSYNEVAGRLGCKVKSIDNALTRIRRKLSRVVLEGDEGDDLGEHRLSAIAKRLETERRIAVR